AFLSSEQNVKRLRRGHQDMWRPLQHTLALMHERIAGADGSPDLRHQQAFFAGQRRDLAQWSFQILLDIVPQCLQRRYIKDFSTVSKIAAQGLTYQTIDADQEGGQSLARASRRGDQGGAAG